MSPRAPGDDGPTPPIGTTLTPAALFQLRGEVEQLRDRINSDRQKVVALERRIEDLEAEVGGQDDRQDAFDSRLSAVETLSRRIIDGVTHGNLIAERTGRHLLAVIAHLHIQVVADE